MSFGQAVRGASFFFPEDGKAQGITRRNRAHQEQLSKESKSSRADFERSLGVFKCTADVDAGHGRRLRRPKLEEDPRLGEEADPTGLPKRRLRKATRQSCLSESSEVSGRRAFFDQFTRAEDYAALIGRPVLSPRPQEQSLLLEGMDSCLLQEKEGDIEDLSTAASDEGLEGRTRKETESVPSLRVRRMLQSLQPAKGKTQLDIPLEVVARLEHLVELADRVESKRRIRSRVLREFSTTPDFQASTPTEASIHEAPLPEAPLPEADEEEEEEAEARPNVQLLVQKYEAPWPTLLRRGNQESVKAQASCSDLPPSAEKSCGDESDTSSPRFTDKELMDKSNALRRKGFNLLPQAGGHGWEQLEQVTLL